MAPLEGIKVLDFTHLLPGEICAAVLSDMGAQVLRIESPNPGLAHKLPPIIDGESLFYWSMQRDKGRVFVDLKTAEGIALIKGLVKDCDIVLENFRTGVMERLGLGYDVLSAINPDLIYLSVTGFGRDSSRKDEPVHDLNLCAETGLLSLNRRRGERPVLPAIPISDYMSGLLAATSIMGALFERQIGQFKRKALDISMSDSALSSLNVLGSMVLYTKKTPEEGGFAYPKEFPNYNVYACKDGGFLAVACLERPFWRKFCHLIEHPELEELIDEPDKENYLTETIAQVIKEKPLDDWSRIFHDSNCCISPVKSLNEAFETYPLKDRGMVSHVTHPKIGNIPQVHFAVAPSLRKKNSGPAGLNLNAENQNLVLALLNKAGYSQDEIDKLVESKVISFSQSENFSRAQT